MTKKQEIKEAIKRLGIKSFFSEAQNFEFDFWDIEKIDEYNEMYNVDEYIPGYYGIGTDGGGELLTVEIEAGIIYSIPFIPMNDSESKEISKSIEELKK
jgi:hypothetical protein